MQTEQKKEANFRISDLVVISNLVAKVGFRFQDDSRADGYLCDACQGLNQIGDETSESFSDHNNSGTTFWLCGRCESLAVAYGLGE